MSQGHQEYDSSHPEVIKAKGEARERMLKARAELHPVAQAIHAFFDSVESCISELGCLLIILVIVLAILAPRVLEALFGR